MSIRDQIKIKISDSLDGMLRGFDVGLANVQVVNFSAKCFGLLGIGTSFLMADSGNSTPLFDIAGIPYCSIVCRGQRYRYNYFNFSLKCFLFVKKSIKFLKLYSK